MLISTLSRFALVTALVAASLATFAQQSVPLNVDVQAEIEYLERHSKQEAPTNFKWDAAHAAPPRPAVPGAVMQRATELFQKPVATYIRQDEPYAAQWPLLEERDIIWSKRVWRTIDASDTANSMFDRKGTSPNLAGILIGLALQGKCAAYGDDRFVKALTNDAIIARIKEGTGVDLSNFNFAQITKFQIKEDWIYDGKSNQLIVRLISIAPMLLHVGKDGTATEMPAFWIYFPEARSALAQQTISNPEAKASNLDEWLDMHRYVGEIDKIRIGKMPGD